nr:unnamed protein product [Spirometra erinaceieuropaei]
MELLRKALTASSSRAVSLPTCVIIRVPAKLNSWPFSKVVNLDNANDYGDDDDDDDDDEEEEEEEEEEEAGDNGFDYGDVA